MITRHVLSKKLRIEEHDVIYTYNDLLVLLDKWHAVFDYLGLAKGDVYVSRDNLSLEQVSLFIAGAERGLVFCAIHDERLMFSDSGYDPSGLAIKVMFTSEASMASATPEPDGSIPCFKKDDMYAFEAIEPTIQAQPEDVMVIGYTSGTTGAPKRYQHTHLSMGVASSYCARRFFKATDLVLSLHTIHHTSVISLQVIPTLIAGAHCIYQRYTGRMLLDTMLTRRPNKMSIMWATLTDALQKNPKWDECRLDFLEEVLTGGSVLNREGLAECFLLDKGVQKLCSVYGSAETNILASLELTKETLAAGFSTEDYPLLGEVFPHYNIRIAEDGELWVRSVAVAPDVVTQDGYFATSDKCFYENGKPYIQGRRERVARVNDIMVSLSKVEGFLKAYRHQDKLVIADCFCFVRENRLYAALDTEATDLSIQALSAYVAERMSNLCTISGFVRIKPTLRPGAIKATWNEDTLKIPKQNTIEVEPHPFKSLNYPAIFKEIDAFKASRNKLRAVIKKK